MSESKLTCGDRDTIIKSKEPTDIMTANGKAESIEDATVFADDLDDAVTMLLLKGSPAVPSLGLSCEEMGYSYEWNKGESPSLIKDGRVIRCKSENHLPIAAVSKELCVSRVPVRRRATDCKS